MNNYYVYVYLNPLKVGKFSYLDYCFLYEPFYIGYGINNRMFQHLDEANKFTDNKTGNLLKIRTINKIKKNNLEPIIIKIEDNLTAKSAKILEIIAIAQIGRRNLNKGPLSNLTDGGDGTIGYLITDEIREKLSIIWKGKKRKPFSKEHKEKLATAAKKCKGYKQSIEHKGKISKANKGKIKSDEHKKNISISRKGIAAWTGLKHTEESKKKISESSKGRRPANAKTVIKYDLYKKELERFSSLNEAVTKTGYNFKGIVDSFKGLRSNYKNYIWMFG